MPLDYEGVGAAGSMLGTKALQIFDDTTCVVRAVLRWTEFYKHESCGKCTPCREGTWWLVQTLARLERGQGTEADLEQRARPVRQHPRPLVLRARRRRDQPDHRPRSSTSGTSTSRTSSTAAVPSTRPRPPSSPPQEPRHERDAARRARRSSKTDLVTLTIDGIETSVPKGTLVIRAAEQIGVQIPRFCDHPLLAPVGACRQCLVEVALPGPDGEPRTMMGPPGRVKPQASCTLVASDGMVVNTQVDLADRRQGPAGGHGAAAHQPPARLPGVRQGRRVPAAEPGDEQRPGRDPVHVEAKRTFPKPINISAQVLLDRERCVLCARCTRFSEQIAGDPFIALIERGALQQVGIYEKEPFESYFSGNTIQICPVGALTSAAYRFRARPFDLVSTPSVAEHDACGSAIRVDHRRGKVVRRLAGDDPQVNEEWITDKDRFAFTYARQAGPAHAPPGPRRGVR